MLHVVAELSECFRGQVKLMNPLRIVSSPRNVTCVLLLFSSIVTPGDVNDIENTIVSTEIDFSPYVVGQSPNLVGVGFDVFVVKVALY